jgi:hypothetical protein
MRSLALALLFFSSPALAADKFDLVCVGKQRLRIGGSWEPVTVRYRIDTSAKVYCAFECTSLEPIASVDAGRITFQQSDDAAPPSSGLTTHYVDRSTGSWKNYVNTGRDLIVDAEGKCEAAPFSGFPPTKF